MCLDNFLEKDPELTKEIVGCKLGTNSNLTNLDNYRNGKIFYDLIQLKNRKDDEQKFFIKFRIKTPAKKFHKLLIEHFSKIEVNYDIEKYIRLNDNEIVFDLYKLPIISFIFNIIIDEELQEYYNILLDYCIDYNAGMELQATLNEYVYKIFRESTVLGRNIKLEDLRMLLLKANCNNPMFAYLISESISPKNLYKYDNFKVMMSCINLWDQSRYSKEKYHTLITYVMNNYSNLNYKLDELITEIDMIDNVLISKFMTECIKNNNKFTGNYRKLLYTAIDYKQYELVQQLILLFEFANLELEKTGKGFTKKEMIDVLHKLYDMMSINIYYESKFIILETISRFIGICKNHKVKIKIIKYPK